MTLLTARLSTHRALVADINLLRRFSGSEAVRAAREASPNFPALHLSGAAADQWAVEGLPNGTMLQRPFALRQPGTSDLAHQNNYPINRG